MTRKSKDVADSSVSWSIIAAITLTVSPFCPQLSYPFRSRNYIPAFFMGYLEQHYND